MVVSWPRARSPFSPGRPYTYARPMEGSSRGGFIASGTRLGKRGFSSCPTGRIGRFHVSRLSVHHLGSRERTERWALAWKQNKLTRTYQRGSGLCHSECEPHSKSIVIVLLIYCVFNVMLRCVFVCVFYPLHFSVSAFYLWTSLRTFPPFVSLRASVSSSNCTSSVASLFLSAPFFL